MTSKLLTPHDTCLQPGATKVEQLNNYRELFRYQLDGNVLQEIRESVNRGLAYGSDRFKEEIEVNLKRRARPGKPGPKPKELLL